MTADCHSLLTLEGILLDADQVAALEKQLQLQQQPQQQQQQQQPLPQLDIATTYDHEDAGTVIHVRGPGSCTRMADLGCVLDKLGVGVVSCSTMPAAGSCDLTLVVADRHDSQPLDDCLLQSVRQGLQGMLQQSPSNHGSPKQPPQPQQQQHYQPQQQQQQQQHSLPADSLAVQQPSSSGPQAQQQQQQQHQQLLQEAAAVCANGSLASSRAVLDLCRADSASEGICGGRVSSRQLGSAVIVQQSEQQPQQHQHQQQHHHQQQQQQQQADSACAQPSTVREGIGSVSASTGNPVAAVGGFAGQVLRHQVSFDAAGIAAAVAAPSLGNTPRSMRPALKIDIPMELSLLSLGLASAPVGDRGARQAARRSTAAATTGFQAHDLAQRLLQLGMQQQESAGILNDDSSSRSLRNSDWQRWQGPLPLMGSSSGEVSVSRVRQRLQRLRQQQDEQQHESFSFSSAEPTGRSSRRNSHCHSGPAAVVSNSTAAGADEDDVGFFAMDLHGSGIRPERSGGSDSMVARSRGAAADAGGELAAPSPRVGSGRRRGPPLRTPSRIILSPVAPDGSDRLFVAIPKQPGKQPGSEKLRRPVARSATASAAATPSSAGRQSVLAGLLGSQGNLGKFGCAAPSPKAAAAVAAAAGMPYNVAVAAAQLLGSSGSTRDAAAAAIAAAVANEQQQYPPGTPRSNPGFAASAPCSAGTSADALRSPVAATPRGGQVPLAPATPVHPAVVAAAAAAIAAAAEAASEEAAAAAAAARQREALAAAGIGSTIAEEDEDTSSMVESVGAEGDAEDSGPEAGDASDEAGSSCSEEWWCGSLTGLTARDIMTGPLLVVSADADVSVARQLMVQHRLPGMLVDVGPGAEPGFLTRR
ncbi:hypothetical protein COO60DRAFT_292343 [Scenedesmus sp. NREL 46B-D3]|nr:hypothetical protein COO60DRAFT_292343 [Scenedesmus sp. NREL 46B-D3]